MDPFIPHVERRKSCLSAEVTEENSADVAEAVGGTALPGGGVVANVGGVTILWEVGDHVVKRPGADFVKMTPEDFAVQWEPDA